MKHKHTICLDRVHEQLAYATALGERKIPTAMTWPVAEIKRALRDAGMTFDDAKQQLLDQFTEGTRDEAGKLIRPAVVYATNPDGSPKFKVGANGEPSGEREVAHGKIQLTNMVDHSREERALGRQEVTIVVPHLSWPQLEGKVPSLEANIVEGLMEYFDDAPRDSDSARAERVEDPDDARERETTARRKRR